MILPPRLSHAAALRKAALVACIGLSVSGCAMNGSMNPAPSGASACADVNFPIYFATGSDVLTDPAHQAIVAGAGEVKGCKVSEVDVFGLAGADGPAGYNLELSRRRAQVVAQALAASGFPQPLFDVKGLGESSARTAKGAPAMLQRKTLVVIHVAKAG